jgi:hypothetical protein
VSALSCVLFCSMMDPITISILSAIAATGAEILIKFLKPHVTKFLRDVLSRHRQLQQSAGGSVRAITAPQLLKEELNKRKQELAPPQRRVPACAVDSTNERLHITLSTSALKQHRIKLRADLADDVHIVSISGLGGRGLAYFKTTWPLQITQVSCKRKQSCSTRALLKRLVCLLDLQFGSPVCVHLTSAIAVFLYAQMLVIILKSATAVKAHVKRLCGQCQAPNYC